MLSLAAAEIERRAALGAVAADVSHELGHTLGFLRCLVIPGSEISEEDRAFANVEVERVQRLMRQLLRLRLAASDEGSVQMMRLLTNAQATLAGTTAAKGICIVVDAPTRVVLNADGGLLYIAVRDMLAAVTNRAAHGSTVTIRLKLPEGAESGSLEISSSAQGAAAAELSDSFDPWNSHSNHPAPLGLAVAYRIARTMGWMLSATESSGAGLHLSIPRSAFASDPA